MKQLTIVIAAALVATEAHARCGVSDIKMSKVFPPGNLSTSDLNYSQAIIRFGLPSDCPGANPPLTACMDLWDTRGRYASQPQRRVGAGRLPNDVQPALP